MKYYLTIELDDEELKSIEKEETKLETFYDETSGQYFKSSLDEILDVADYLNGLLISGKTDFVYLNTFYEMLKLNADVAIGRFLGWDRENRIDIDIVVAKDGTKILKTNPEFKKI